MGARVKFLLARIAGFLAFAFIAAAAGEAVAGGGGCNCTPPPCCAPPTPPTPPNNNCCQSPGHNVNVPGVNVFVGATVFLNANVNAQTQATASAMSNSVGNTAILVGGGGGGGGGFSPGPQSLLQNLNVEGEARRASFEATRTKIKKVVIEAVCIDDKTVPHPASQVTPDRDIEDSYDGELFRCIAGTHLQATFAEYFGHVSFDHGQNLDCQKNEALYHFPGGKVECHAQKPARDCNERSLLRRFGAGVKILTMITVEKYTETREEKAESSSSGSMILDGGVGGVMY
jgi:hypothetical protein